MEQISLNWNQPVNPVLFNQPLRSSESIETTLTSNIPTVSSSATASIFVNDKWTRIWQTLKEDKDLCFVDKENPISLSELITNATESIYKAIVDGYTVFIGYSAGKDSTSVLILFLMALMRAHREGKELSPHHCVQHTNTGVENPEVSDHAGECLYDLELFIEKHNLPLSIIIAEPMLTQSWTGRILTGRGLPTFTGSHRQCSIDMKIEPAKKAKKKYIKSIGKEYAQKTLLLLGSRDDEGRIRANNISKFNGQADKPVLVKKYEYEMYPIKKWSTSNVWEFLLSCGDNEKYPLPNFRESSADTAELYKDATGECVWSGEEALKSKSCGSRFGCWACQTGGGDDKSASNLIKSNEKYAYLKPLYRIQQLLAKTRYDWSLRHPVGRTIDDNNGRILIKPDVYSPIFLERLLRACITADVLEEERAYQHARDLISGKLEDNKYNRRMISPQFKIVSETQLVHVDFLWALHGFNSKPFRALEIYHEVTQKNMLEELLDVDEMEHVKRTPIPKAKYLKVGKWEDGSLHDGLSDPFSPMVYFEPNDDERAQKTVKTKTGNLRVMSILEDSSLTVNEEAAHFIVHTEFKDYLESKMDTYNSVYAFQYYLRFGAVSLSKGKLPLYHKMAQRGQCYRRMGLNGQHTIDEILNNPDFDITDKP